MEPTPPSPESTPSPEDDGVKKLMADIGRIIQELRAYNKRPLPATEEQVKKLIQNEKERPIHVPAEKVVEQLMGKTEELVTKFQSIYNEFLTLLNSQTRTLRQELTTQVAAMQTAVRAGEAAARAMQASADAVAAAGKKVKEDLPTSVPVRGEVYGFTNEKTMVWTVVGCLLLGALLFWALPSSKVSKEVYEQAQVRQMQAEEANVNLQKQGNYYLNQIKKYKAKNPKTTDFPTYKPAD